MSLSVDFYVRLFVRVFTGQKKCKETTSKLGHVYQCSGCEILTVQPMGRLVKDDKGNVKYVLPKGPPVDQKCKYCAHSHIIGGPMWIDPIHDTEFVSRVRQNLEEHKHLGTTNRIDGMLSMVEEELPDVPFYYLQDRLCTLAKVAMPKMTTFNSAILNAGYRVSNSHACRNSIKTDAPADFLWDMIRAYEKTNLSNRKNWTDVSRAILGRESSFSPSPVAIDFTVHEKAEPLSRKNGVLRFQHNPPNWGPKSKARVFGDVDKVAVDKRARNQGKHSQKRQKKEENGANKRGKVDEN